MHKLTTPYNWSILTYGMMLAGKSYIGKKLAQKLKIDFEDLDEYLVKYLWVRDISEYINTKIEEHLKKNGDENKALAWVQAWHDFHTVENECLQILLWDEKNRVIAPGGKTIMHQPNRSLIANTKWLIRYYLQVDLDEQIRRAKSLKPAQLKNRPALENLSWEQIDTFFTWMQAERSKMYEWFSWWNIINTGWEFDLFDDVVEKIVGDIIRKMNS